MSFAPIEQSRQDARPFELYEFRYGSGPGMVYRYTNSTVAQAHGSQQYDPVPINRGNLKTNGKLDKGTLNIQVPINTDLANLFLDWPPAQTVMITIRAGHLGDGDQERMVVFVGRVLSTSRGETEISLTCENSIVSMKRPTNKRCWQFACPYALYDERCGASKALARKTVTVLDVTEAGELRLEDEWYLPRAPADYRGGLIEWNNAALGKEARQIKTVTTERMTIIGIVRGVVPGDTVDIYLGCGRNMNDCRRLHNNILNYGGQPHIPLKNPVKQHPFW